MSIITTGNSWDALRRFTQARIALGRAGTSLPTRAHLEFQLAHARARDAVHHALDAESMASALLSRGLRSFVVHSSAPDRASYLQRPDLGRLLSERSTELMATLAGERADVSLVIADGLSAFAIEQNALPLVDVLIPRLQAIGLTLAPVAIVRQGRVAIGDPIARSLGARLVVVLIGERPGLSSPDSMGIYMTWSPVAGTTDAQRNCISNIRRDGLAHDAAGFRLVYLITEAFRRACSGVALKDETGTLNQQVAMAGVNFLLE